MFPELRRIKSISSYQKRTGTSLQKLKKNMEETQKKYLKQRAKSEPTLLLNISMPKKGLRKRLQSLNQQETSLEKQIKKSPKRDKKSLSNKIIQVQKLRTQLRKSDPQKKLKIDNKTNLRKIQLDKDQYQRLEYDSQQLRGLNPILQNNKVILESEQTEIYSISRFEELVKIFRKLSHISFFRYFLQVKIFNLWKNKIKKNKHKKSKEQSIKHINYNYYRGLSKIKIITLRELQKTKLVFFNKKVMMQDFGELIVNNNFQNIQNVCNNIHENVFETAFEQFYQENHLDRSLSIAEKQFLLLQKSKPQMCQFKNQFEHLRETWTNFKFSKIINQLQSFLKLIVYELNCCFHSYYKVFLKDLQFHLENQLNLSQKIPYTECLNQAFSNGPIQNDNFMKIDQIQLAGISIAPQIQISTLSLGLNFNQKTFQTVFDIYINKVRKLMRIRQNIELNCKGQTLLLNQILKSNNVYKAQVFIDESQEITELNNNIKKLLKENIQYLHQIYSLAEQTFKELASDIRTKSTYFQECESLIQNFEWQKQKKIDFRIQQVLKQTNEIEKHKSLLIQSFLFYKDKMQIVRKLPKRMKAGIFSLELSKLKQIFLRLTQKIQNNCIKLLVRLVNKVQKCLHFQFKSHTQKISLYYCEIQEFVESTKTQIYYEQMYPYYLAYIDNIKSILSFLKTQSAETNITRYDTQCMIVKLELQKLQQKIDTFELQKVSKLKEFFKNKKNKKDQIKIQMTILQNQIRQLIFSSKKTLSEKFSYISGFQTKVYDLRQVIDNFLFVENMQIDYCIENCISQFAAFSKLENDVTLLKDLIQKFIEVQKKIKEIQDEDFYQCETQQIYNIIQYALSQTKVSQLALIPYTNFIQTIKDQYTDMIKFFKILYELQMFSQDQLNQIYGGKIFNFKNKKYYTVKQVKDVHIEHYYYEIKGISAKKFYEMKVNQIQTRFDYLQSQQKISKQILYHFQDQNNLQIYLGQTNRRKKSRITDIRGLNLHKQNHIKQQLEQISHQIIQVYQILNNFNKNNNHPNNSTFALTRAIQIQYSIQNILEILDICQRIGKQLENIQQYYQIIKQTQLPMSIQLLRDIQKLKQKWFTQVIQYITGLGIGIIIRQQKKIREIIQDVQSIIESIYVEIDSKIESSIKQTPILYLFPKKLVLKFLSKPQEFFLYNYQFIQDAYFDNNKKQFIIETIYEQVFAIKLLQTSRFSINQIKNKICKMIDQNLTKSIRYKQQGTDFGTQSNILQIQFVSQMINLHEQMKKLSKNSRKGYLNERIKLISDKNSFSNNKMLKAEIFISACIEMRENLSLNQQSQLLTYFYYSYSDPNKNDQNQKCSQISELYQSHKNKVSYSRPSKKNKTLIQRRSTSNIKKENKLQINKKIKNFKVKEQEQPIRERRSKSEKQVSLKGKRIKRVTNAVIMDQNIITNFFKRNKKSSESYNVFYCNIFQKLELNNDLIDFRTMFFYPGSQRMLLSYFNALYHPQYITKITSFETIQQFSSRLFQNAFLIDKNILKREQFESALENISKMQNITLVITEFEEFYKKYGKKIEEIQYQIALKDVKFSLQDHQNLMQTQRIKSIKSRVVPNIFILSQNQSDNHIPFAIFNPTKAHTYRTLNYEPPPIQIKLQVYRYILEERFPSKLIDVLISYMKTYSLFIKSSKYSDTTSNQLKSIFLWLIQEISENCIQKKNKYGNKKLSLYDILVVPFKSLKLPQFQEQFIVTRFFEEISPLISLYNKQDIDTQQDICFQIQQCLHTKKIIVLVGAQFTGKSYQIAKFLKYSHSHYITLNVKVQNLLSQILSSQLHLEQYIKNYQGRKSHRFNMKKFYIIFEGFLTNKNSLLYDFIIDSDNNEKDDNICDGYIFQEQNLSQVTPKSIPHISIINIDSRQKIIQGYLNQIESDFLNLFQQAKTHQRKLKIRKLLLEVPCIIKQIIGKMQKKYWNYVIDLSMIVKNVAKMLKSLLNIIEQQQNKQGIQIQKPSLVLQIQKYIIGYSIFWVVSNYLSGQGQRILIKIKQDISQLSILGCLQDPVQCQMRFRKYSINCMDLYKNQNTNRSTYLQFSFFTPQNQLLLFNTLCYLTYNDQIIVYGDSGSGKTKLIEQILIYVSAQKKLNIFTSNYSSIKYKINSFNECVLAIDRTKQSNVSCRQFETHTISKNIAVIIQDNALDIKDKVEDSDILFYYLKFITQNNYIYNKNKFSFIPNICAIIQRRQKYEKNNINWDASPIYYKNQSQSFNKIFTTIIKNLQNINYSSATHSNHSNQIQDDKQYQILKLQKNHTNQILQNLKQCLKQIQKGKFSWLNILNKKYINKSLIMILKTISQNSIRQVGQLCASQKTHEPQTKRPSICNSFFEKQTRTNNSNNSSVIQQFNLILQFNLISMLQQPLNHNYNLKQVQKRVNLYLKKKKDQLQSYQNNYSIPINIQQKKQNMITEKIKRNLRKLYFSIQVSQTIFINQLKNDKQLKLLPFLFQILGKKLVKIQGRKHEAISQIKRYQSLQPITYFYIPLQTLQNNPDLLAYIQMRTKQNFSKFMTNHKNQYRSSLKMLSSEIIKTSKGLSKDSNSSTILKQIPDQVFIIQYPTNQQNTQIITKFLQSKSLSQNATILWLTQHQNSTISINEQSVAINLKQIRNQPKNNSLLNQIIQQYKSKSIQSIKNRFKLIENLYDSIKTVLIDKIPEQLWNFLFRYDRLATFMKISFRLYHENHEKITGYIKTTESVLNAFYNIFQDTQKINNQLNHHWNKQRDKRFQIIELQKQIDQLEKKVAEFEGMGVIEEFSKLKLDLIQHRKEEQQYYKQVQKYRQNANKAQQSFTRQQIAQLKYFFNTKFLSYKNLFESIFHCLYQQQSVPDKDILKKCILDINLCSKMKQKNLLQIKNQRLIETIGSKLQDCQTENGKNIYNWMSYSLKYRNLILKKQKIMDELINNKSKVNARISDIQSNYNINDLKQRINLLKQLKIEYSEALTKIQRSKIFLNNKLLRLEPIVQNFKNFKDCCLLQLNKFKKYESQMESIIITISIQYVFSLSVPQIYRSSFRKAVKKQMTRTNKVKPIPLQNCFDAITNLISNDENCQPYYENQMLLTKAKKIALLGLSHKIKNGNVLVYDPYNHFIKDLQIDFIQLDYQDLFTSEIMVMIMNKSLIVIRLPQNEWDIEYICRNSYQKAIKCDDFQEINKIKAHKTEIKLLKNQRCVFTKQKMSKLPSKAQKYQIICYDFNSMEQDKQFSDRAIKYKFSLFHKRLNIKKKDNQTYKSLEKYERNNTKFFYDITQKICRQIMSFTINQTNHLQKFCGLMQNYYEQHIKINKTRNLFQYKDYINQEIQQQRLSQMTGIAFQVFKKLASKSPKICNNRRVKQNIIQQVGIQNKIDQKILLTGIQIAARYSLQNRKFGQKLSKSFLRFFIHYLITGINDIDQYFIELKLLVDDNQNGHVDQNQIKIQKVEYFREIINEIKCYLAHNNKLNIQRIKNTFNNVRISKNLNCEKLVGAIIKKKEKQNIQEKQILTMIQNNYEINEADKICIKQIFGCQKEIGSSQRVILSQVAQDMQKKYYYENKNNSICILISHLFKESSAKYIKTEKGLKHQRIDRNQNKVNFICETKSKFWKNFILNYLSKSEKHLYMKSGAQIKYLVLKLSKITHWKKIVSEIGERQLEDQPQIIQNIILQEYLLIIIQDSFTEKSLNTLRSIIYLANTIILTQNKSTLECNFKSIDNYDISLGQFLGIFINPQLSINKGIIYKDNREMIKFWQKKIVQLALKRGNLTVNLYIILFYELIKEFISSLQKLNIKLNRKISIFQQNLKTVLKSHLFFHLFENTEQLNNFMKNSLYLRGQTKNLQINSSKLWSIIQTKNKPFISEQQIVFLSKRSSDVNHILKQNIFKLKVLEEKLLNISIQYAQKSEGIRNISEAKITIKNSTKKKLLSQIINSLTEITKNHSSQPYLSRQNYCNFINKEDVFAIKEIDSLLYKLVLLQNQLQNQSVIFLNSIQCPYSIYLLNLIYSQPIKLTQFQSNHQNNNNKIQFIFQTYKGKKLRAIKQLNDQSVLPNVLSKPKNTLGGVFSYRLTTSSHYFGIEFNHGVYSNMLPQ